MPAYQGTKRINQILDAGSIDKHLQRMEQFDTFYGQIMGQAVRDAVEIAGDRAAVNAPKLTGALSGSIFKKYLGVNKSNMQIRGAIGSKGQGLKAFAQEVGRWYGRRYWKGRFYLYYGAVDKQAEIMKLYEQANDEIVRKLVVK